MVNSKDITPEYIQLKYESESLGNLKITLPKVRKYVGNGDGNFLIEIDLENLWKHVANLYTWPVKISNVEKEKVTPKNISSVCIYGSTLYKHFPTDFIRARKKWFGFGKEVVETIKRKRKKPSDLDLMVITKEPVGKELFFPGKENMIKTIGEKSGSYGSFTAKGNIKLHLTYRSEKQFYDTLTKGDKLTEAVIEYGLPLVGESNFERILSGILSPIQRNCQHEVEWNDDAKILYGTIVEREENYKNKVAKSKQKEEVKIKPIKTSFINPWNIEIPKIEQK